MLLLQIDVYLTNARSSAWVFDTGSLAHICNSKPTDHTRIDELFSMLKAAEVEIKKEHQVLMVNKTTSFKKKGKGKKGNFKKNSKQVAALGKKPKSGRKPETECLTR